MKTNLRTVTLLLWGLGAGACGPQEDSVPESSAGAIAKLSQGLVTERWGYACSGKLRAYAAVDRYDVNCIASIVQFDDRELIISPSGRRVGGVVCVRILDGISNPLKCEVPGGLDPSYPTATWITSAFLPHNGYPCEVTAYASIDGYGQDCHAPAAQTASASVSETRYR